MAAVSAFDRPCGVIVSQKQRLDLSGSERTQYPAQAGNAACVGFGEADSLHGLGAAALINPFPEDGVGVLMDLLVSYARNVGGKASDETLLDVGMQVRLQLRPITGMASDNKPLPEAFFKVGAQPLCDCLEMLQR